MFFFFQAEDGIRDIGVTGVQTCALPIYQRAPFKLNGHEQPRIGARTTQRRRNRPLRVVRSEEHTSELQSRQYLVCRLLLEKKKKKETSQPPLYIVSTTTNVLLTSNFSAR